MATSKSIVEVISAAHFLASEEQVGRLAYAVQEGQAADVTYLRVILAHTRSRMARVKRGTNVEAVLDQVHDRFYPVVLRTVGTEEMPTAELNSRANFARSAASTVRVLHPEWRRREVGGSRDRDQDRAAQGRCARARGSGRG